MEGQKSDLEGKLTILNTFLSCDVQGVSDLPLNEMAQKIRSSRYNQKRYPALIIRKSSPQTTILLFKSERVIIITSAAEHYIPILMKNLQRDWQKVLNTKTLKLSNLVVHNMMAKFEVGIFGNIVGFKIDLGKICEAGQGFKNENMPGVIFKIKPIKDYVKSVIVHGSGKVLMMGGISIDNLERAYAYLLKELSLYRWKPRILQREEKS